jgi:hypothetical protein
VICNVLVCTSLLANRRRCSRAGCARSRRPAVRQCARSYTGCMCPCSLGCSPVASAPLALSLLARGTPGGSAQSCHRERRRGSGGAWLPILAHPVTCDVEICTEAQQETATVAGTPAARQYARQRRRTPVCAAMSHYPYLAQGLVVRPAVPHAARSFTAVSLAERVALHHGKPDKTMQKMIDQGHLKVWAPLLPAAFDARLRQCVQCRGSDCRGVPAG